LRKIHTVLAAACLAGLAGAEALAGQVTMDFTGTGRGQGVQISMAGHSLPGGGNVFAGQLKWNVTSSTQSGINPGAVITFCTDIFQAVQSGTFDIADLADAPDTGIGGMGDDKAALIGHLYSVYYDEVNDSSATNDRASAFQVAIWEIVNEDITFDAGPLAELDVTNGDFQASGLDGAADDVAEMLGEVSLAWEESRLENEYGLVAALGNGQDQIMIVPVPPAVWLAGVGLLGVGVLRRRCGPGTKASA